jgi:hypothetical protein
VGSGVSDWKVGDEVRYFVNNGNFSCLSLNFFFVIHKLLMLQSPQVPKNIMQSTNPTCASSLSLSSSLSEAEHQISILFLSASPLLNSIS